MHAELHAAWAWDCDQCGRENFVRAIEGNIDEAALAADENQVVGLLAAPDVVETDVETEDGERLMESEVLQQVIVIAPQHVTCTHCGSSFKTELPSELE